MAVENNTGINAIALCRTAAMMLKKASFDDKLYTEILSLGYQAGNDLSDELLKLSDIAFIAFYYSKELELAERFDEEKQIDDRMSGVFGSDWKKNIPEFKRQHTNSSLEYSGEYKLD